MSRSQKKTKTPVKKKGMVKKAELKSCLGLNNTSDSVEHNRNSVCSGKSSSPYQDKVLAGDKRSKVKNYTQLKRVKENIKQEKEDTDKSLKENTPQLLGVNCKQFVDKDKCQESLGENVNECSRRICSNANVIHPLKEINLLPQENYNEAGEKNTKIEDDVLSDESISEIVEEIIRYHMEKDKRHGATKNENSELNNTLYSEETHCNTSPDKTFVDHTADYDDGEITQESVLAETACKYSVATDQKIKTVFPCETVLIGTMSVEELERGNDPSSSDIMISPPPLVEQTTCPPSYSIESIDPEWAGRLPLPPGCVPVNLTEYEPFKIEYDVTQLPPTVRTYVVLKGITENEINVFSGARVEYVDTSCLNKKPHFCIRARTVRSMNMAIGLIVALIKEGFELLQAEEKKKAVETEKVLESNKPAEKHTEGRTVNKPVQEEVRANNFEMEYEINDFPLSVRTHIMLKGIIENKVTFASGAKVRTKGCYVVPEKKKYSRLKPLYVFIEATSEESINLAVKVLEELKAEAFQLAESSIVRKVPVGLEDAPVAFDLLNRLLGQGGANLRHIENQTGATVSLRGQQSGFIKFTNNKESEEPLHIRVEHKKEDIVVEAQRLALNLVQTIKDDFKEFSKYESQKFSYIPTTSTIPAPSLRPPPPRFPSSTVQPGVTTPATPPQRLQTRVTSPATSAQRLHPRVTTPATPAKRLHSGVTTPATPIQRLHSEVTTPATPAQRLHPEITTPATPAQRLHPEVTTPATPAQRLPSGVPTPATPPQRLHPGVTTPATPPQRLHPGVTTPATPAQRLHPGVTTPATPAQRLHPGVITPATPIQMLQLPQKRPQEPTFQTGQAQSKIPRVASSLSQNPHNKIKFTIKSTKKTVLPATSVQTTAKVSSVITSNPADSVGTVRTPRHARQVINQIINSETVNHHQTPSTESEQTTQNKANSQLSRVVELLESALNVHVSSLPAGLEATQLAKVQLLLKHLVPIHLDRRSTDEQKSQLLIVLQLLEKSMSNMSGGSQHRSPLPQTMQIVKKLLQTDDLKFINPQPYDPQVEQKSSQLIEITELLQKALQTYINNSSDICQKSLLTPVLLVMQQMTAKMSTTLAMGEQEDQLMTVLDLLEEAFQNKSGDYDQPKLQLLQAMQTLRNILQNKDSSKSRVPTNTSSATTANPEKLIQQTPPPPVCVSGHRPSQLLQLLQLMVKAMQTHINRGGALKSQLLQITQLLEHTVTIQGKNLETEEQKTQFLMILQLLETALKSQSSPGQQSPELLQIMQLIKTTLQAKVIVEPCPSQLMQVMELIQKTLETHASSMEVSQQKIQLLQLIQLLQQALASQQRVAGSPEQERRLIYFIQLVQQILQTQVFPPSSDPHPSQIVQIMQLIQQTLDTAASPPICSQPQPFSVPPSPNKFNQIVQKNSTSVQSHVGTNFPAHQLMQSETLYVPSSTQQNQPGLAEQLVNSLQIKSNAHRSVQLGQTATESNSNPMSPITLQMQGLQNQFNLNTPPHP
ncbi:uncharacterized protein LOC124367007 isoform X3 [Homalodisca vitripennis]|nr:uncharacterized protein LOC124367007 isoform X3 [Homalodisca vitripennis]